MAARKHVTRGTGLLEAFLARARARVANRLIPSSLRDGRILDVGCGSTPYFLAHTSFKEKFAIDQQPGSDEGDIRWHALDLNNAPQVPFEDGYFSAVTMLAVIEHLSPSSVVRLFQEAHRVLAPGGVVVMTTPASWSNGLLKVMASVNLVSAEEIDEHVFTYTLPLIGWYFGKAGFEMEKLRFGYFQARLNMWAVAQK
ncbi:MAG: class I SAM-dependent methyltransferase [Candidatus Polarisedimenticolia bacterium]